MSNTMPKFEEGNGPLELGSINVLEAYEDGLQPIVISNPVFVKMHIGMTNIHCDDATITGWKLEGSLLTLKIVFENHAGNSIPSRNAEVTVNFNKGMSNNSLSGRVVMDLTASKKTEYGQPTLTVQREFSDEDAAQLETFFTERTIVSSDIPRYEDGRNEHRRVRDYPIFFKTGPRRIFIASVMTAVTAVCAPILRAQSIENQKIMCSLFAQGEDLKKGDYKLPYPAVRTVETPLTNFELAQGAEPALTIDERIELCRTVLGRTVNLEVAQQSNVETAKHSTPLVDARYH